MKHAVAVVACLLLALSARAQTPTVRIQETVTLEIPGATAVYTTNPTIADATIISPGLLSVTGHSAGTTQLMVITAGGTQSFVITVAPATAPTLTRPAAGVPQVRYEGRYSSGAERVQNAVDATTTHDSHRSEFHVLHIHDLLAGEEQNSDSIASIFYRYTSASRVLTLLDEMVDVSPVTVSNTRLRGVHLRQGPLELHGGYASPAMYDRFFLPAERRGAAGAGYGMQRGAIRWTPSVYGFFADPAVTTVRRGVVGALTAEYGDRDSLFARGDIGVSRSIAASAELGYISPRTRFRALLSIKPDDFPTLGLGDIRGEHLELDWTRHATDRLALSAYGTYDHFDLGLQPQTIGSSRVGVTWALTKRLSFITGAEASTIRTPTASIETIGLPFGLAYEAPGYGLAAAYRLLDHSGASRRGDTLRFSAHARRGRFSANAWAERQRQAPTLDLIFSSQPGLELALIRLGISVRTPEDLARALRDNAALVDLGFITGVNVDLTPRRIQAGLNLGWIGLSRPSDHLRLFGVFNRHEGVSTTRETMLATLTYSRRILEATDIFGSWSWYSTTVGSQEQSDTSVDIGLRQHFSGLPSFLRRSGMIEGVVFLDPEMRGEMGETTEGLPDIVVTLDGTRSVRTDARGAYSFHDVSPGTHRIAAQLPASPRAFFTTPSHAETTVPARINFGLVWTAARIDGRVTSDAGEGISGVVLSVSTPDGTPNSATTDTDGHFVFAVPPGTFQVALAPMSLPPGYTVAGEHEQSVTAEPDRPQTISFEVQAIRSVSGRAPGATEVVIESLGRTARVDEDGNFVFRSMPSGTFTLTAVTEGERVSGSVTLPEQPATVRDVLLADPMVVAAVASDAPTPGRFRVAAGAFRIPANAAAAVARIEASGGTAEITRSGVLHLVTVGPFASREAARTEALRLQAAGVDTVVVADRVPEPRPYVVQTGAFRETQNAAALVNRLTEHGQKPFTIRDGSLTYVYVGPFETREQAVHAGARLRRGGFESYVTRR